LEIQENRLAWDKKPLLREIYRGFYQKILELIDPSLPGRTVEIGSGIGNLKDHSPSAIATDIFPNPWLDLTCDGYQLPFAAGTLSHLILFDVFHHLRWPRAFLREADRVLAERGRLLLFEPYISWVSLPVYGLFHHEPVAWHTTIETNDAIGGPQDYYAAQGNATRLFFLGYHPGFTESWELFHREAFASFSYLLSGGFRQRAFYPQSWLPRLQRFDQHLARWPRLFGARCLVGLRRR